MPRSPSGLLALPHLLVLSSALVQHDRHVGGRQSRHGPSSSEAGLRRGPEDTPLAAWGGKAPRALSTWRTRNCLQPASDRVTMRLGDPGEPYVDSTGPVSAWPNRTKRMIELDTVGWRELRPIPYVKVPPKLALLMFASTVIHNEEAWVQWIRQAEHDRLALTFLIHSTDLRHEFQSKRLSRYLVKGSLGAEWCNMWAAEMMMMRMALRDDAVSHVITLSRDSIPVKPLWFIYQALEADPATRMCADDGWRGRGGTPRAESWFLMRSEDAQLFLENSLLARRHFTSEGCVDEQAWYYPLKVREEIWGKKYAVRNECPMFADWADGNHACKDWRTNVELCTGCGALRRGAFVPADAMHPASFKNVSAEALQGLLDSPFWFARKFEDGAIGRDALALLA